MSTIARFRVSVYGVATPNVIPVSSEWMTRGNCLGEDPDIFHSPYAPVQRIAAKVCNSTPCPVREQCLDYALEHMEEPDQENPDPVDHAIGRFGVWGGSLPADRWRILGRRPARYGSAA